MIKIVFLCARFGGGGAEMHLLRVLTHTDFSKFEIHLALTRDNGNYEQRLPREVTIHHLTKNIGSSTVALLKSARPLKKLIEELNPAAVVSFMDPQNILLSYLKKTSKKFPPVIFACQNAPIKSLSNDGFTGKTLLLFVPKWYDKYADKIIAICDGVKQELIHKLNIKAPVKVIYNAGFDESYRELANEQLLPEVKKNDVQLVACGRLTKQKGFDVLMKALSLIKTDRSFSVWLLGEGEDKDKLLSLVNEFNLSDKVKFMGFQSNPYKFFYNADIFVLSSLWEGFGNVITEAMICNCAVVAANCDYGPNEIITDNLNGLLSEVNDADSLATKIEYLIQNKDIREKLVTAGAVRALDFSAVEISRQYFDEIEKTINLQ